MTHANGHSEQTTGGGDVGHSGAASGRVQPDARRIVVGCMHCRSEAAFSGPLACRDAVTWDRAHVGMCPSLSAPARKESDRG